MMIVKRILVPMDFGQTSEAALACVVDLARMFGARLYLLHVFDVAAVREYPVPQLPAPDTHALEQLAGLLPRLLSGTDRREPAFLRRPSCVEPLDVRPDGVQRGVGS